MARQKLSLEVGELRLRLEEAQDALRAIRNGEVDALVGSGADGGQVFVLKGSEQPYREFVETMSEGAVTLMADGTIAYCNQRFADLLQRPLEQVMSGSLEDFVAPDHRRRLRPLLGQALAGSTKQEIPFLSGGTTVWAELSLCPTKLEGAPGICLVATDITGRKKTEELRAYLAAIVDSTDDAIIGKSLDGTILTWNAGAERLYGYSAAEIVGQSVAVLWPPDRPDAASQILERIDRGETVDHYEAERVCRDGHRIQVSLTVSPIRDLEGRIRGASAIARDITERKRAEEELRRANAYNRSLIEASLDPLVTIAPDGTITDVNHATEEVTGRSRQELIGTDFSNYFSEPERARRGYQQVFREGSIQDYELELRKPDGGTTPVLYNASVYRDGAGNVIGVFAAARDITARKQAEAARRESETALRTLTDAMPQIVWMCTPDGLNVYFNQQWVDYTGMSLAESYGTGWNIPFHPNDRQAAWDAWNHATETGETYRIESRLRAADGSYRWFLMRGVPLRDASGRIVKWFGTCTDIEELKRAGEEIEQLNANLERRVAERTAELVAANQELEAFSYSVSHDLRTPLRAMDGFSQALMEDYADKLDSEGKGYLKRVRAASQRMGQLVDGLLNLSRLTRGELRRTRVDLSGLARAVALELRNANPQRLVEFEPAPGLFVNADASLLSVVLHNLLGNAWKFTSTHPQARVEVGSLEQDGETAYFVRDDGAGFDMRYADKLFGAFQRLHAPAEFEGTGIGLATVQRIINRHGGRIWASSEVEKGATFFFTLSANSR